MKDALKDDQHRPSMSKKITIMGLAGLFVLFLLIVVAITGSDSGKKRQGATPQNLFEPSEKNATDIEIMAKQQERPQMPEIELVEVEDINAEIAYIPPQQMSIEAKRRTDHGLRTMAANATTSLGNFQLGSYAEASAKNRGGDSVHDPNAHLQAEINAAKQQEAMSHAAAMGGGGEGGQSKDPNGWDSKDRFIAGYKGLDGYSKHFRQPQISTLELKAGTIIPCVLISGIISDLPGNSLGQITEDVYDSATGKNILIPKGSKVVGTYDHRIAYGQSRLLVVWSKLVYPDGSTLILENLSGADQSGYTGYKGQVNRHWNTLISSALVVSLLGAGVDLATPSSSGRYEEDNNTGSVLAENASRAVAEAMSKVIEREVDRAPTIKIKPGKRFLLFVKQDIAFAEKWK